MVRVRFAPSPTGYLHIGGLRTALYAELMALRHGGAFVLRIEDTDRTRLVEGAVESLLRALAWSGVTPTEGPYLAEDGTVKERGDFGPYVQSQRLDIYKKYAAELLANGHAYHCFCTAERLDEIRKKQSENKEQVMYDGLCRNLAKDEVAAKLAANAPHVVRLRVPRQGRVEFTDAVRGLVSFAFATLDDQVLMKTDGFPTYHMAVVVDDHLMNITHVIRAEEWLSSTPKHLLLYQAFGWKPPEFAHLPQVLNADRTKLSKRQGDVSVEDYQKKGYLPEAIINFLALQGWNPTSDREIYYKSELTAAFDLHKINKAGAIFNVEKLDWFNREYLKKLSSEAVFEAVLPFLEPDKQSRAAKEKAMVMRAVSLEQTRAKTLVEIAATIDYVFTDRQSIPPAIIPGKKGTPEIAKARLDAMADLFSTYKRSEYDDYKVMEQLTLEHIKEKGWTNAETLWPLRVALSGKEASPSPFELAWVLGKEQTLARIAAAVDLLA